MSSDFMDSVDNGINWAKEELLNIERNYQKSVIRFWTASRSYSTSETRKSVLKTMKQTTIDEIKEQSTTFSNAFTTSAKGEWVDKAKEVMEEATKKFDDLG